MDETPQGALERIVCREDLHPGVVHMLRQFKYEHLPPHLQDISKGFCLLAAQVADNAKTQEATVALRKLREAKDCAVLDRVLGDQD
jgi:hypothetical protein